MKSTYLLIAVVFALLIAITGCSKSDNSITNSMTENNLIPNSSFETASSPSLAGWIPGTADTTAIKFVTDTPPGGGSYSVYLHLQPSLEASVICPVAIPAGTHHYRLSAWGKAGRLGSGIGRGGMSILYTWGSPGSGKSLSFSDTTWTYQSLLDTLSVTQSDSVRIFLGVGQTGYMLYDLCKFDELD